jgi:hypothetical protein
MSFRDPRIDWKRGENYVYLHVFVEAVIHDEGMTHPNSMGFHRMTRTIRIIPKSQSQHRRLKAQRRGGELTQRQLHREEDCG